MGRSSAEIAKPISSSSDDDNIFLPEESGSAMNPPIENLIDLSSSDGEDSEKNTDSSGEYQNDSTKKNFVKLVHLPLAADRYGLSDEAVAAIASATLVDFGLVSENDTQNLIDKNKIRRARKKLRLERVESMKGKDIAAFFFDGRKDASAQYSDNRLGTSVVEHISMIANPGSFFVGHVASTSGSAKDIFEAITNSLTGSCHSIQNMKAIGCDGAPTNTGADNGIIRRFENLLQRPLQWLICLIHCNELILKAMINKLDGPTKGPNGRSHI